MSMTTEPYCNKLGATGSMGVRRAHGLVVCLMLGACATAASPTSESTAPPASADTDDGPSGGGSSPASMSSSGGGTGTPNGTNDAGGGVANPGARTGAMMASDGGPGKKTGSTNAACNPADKKPDPTPVALSMIQGYSAYGTKAPTTGPLKPVIETDPGLDKWTVYRPDDLSTMLHPILVWAEGGCLNNGTLYGQFLLEAASHGFIALGEGIPTDPSADPGTNGSSAMMSMTGAIDWITAENDRPCSQYYQQVAVSKVAVSGQSCGGGLALAAAGDKRVTTAIINNSGLGASVAGAFSSLHTPIAYFIGGSSDIAYDNAETDYMNINNVPIFNANDPVGHGATWAFVNGGEFGRVNIGWLKWQLMDDMTASKMFLGADCELCKSSTWTVKKKMLQ